MKKIIFFILVIIIVIISGLFIVEKINQNKRKYEIEEISDFKYFIYKEKEKFGVIDKTGNVIIEASYEKIEIPNPSKAVFICYNNGKGIAKDSNNQQLFAEYNSVEGINLTNVASNVAFEKSVLKTEKNSKYGLIDFSGKKIINTEFDSIEGIPGIEGELQVEKDGKFGVVNIKGTTLVKPEYDTVLGDNYYNEDMKHGYIVGHKEESGYNYGYINSKGKLIVKTEYNDISRVTDISADEGVFLIAAKNGQYGVIKNKKSIISHEYQAIEFDKTNKVYILQKSKSYGVANNLGKIIIPVEKTNIQAKGEYIYVENNNLKEVYDKNGNKANIEFSKTIINTSNEKYKIIINNEDKGNYYGVIDSNNKQVIKSEYLYIEYAFDNYFIVCSQNGKLGILDNNGKTVIDLKYDLVQKIQGKNMIQTLYSETNTTEIYSEKMEKVCEMPNATIENLADYVKISSNKDIKYINNNGEVTLSSKILPENKLFVSSKNDKWGYIDANGNIVVEYKYDYATELNKYGYAAIKKDDKWGAINSEGKIVVEPKYSINEKYEKVEFIGEYVKVNSGFGNEYYTKEL